MRTKIIGVLFLSFLFAPMSHAQTVFVRNLAELSWNYRLIILNGNVLPKETLTTLADANAGINDRQIVWLWLKNDTIKTNLHGSLADQARRQISEQVKEVNVVLIGKDGQPKYQGNDFSLQSLFVLIDQMPMRRQEMQN